MSILNNDDDPRIIAAAIANGEARAEELRARVIETQARTIATLGKAFADFEPTATASEIIDAVTSNDLRKLMKIKDGVPIS